MPHRKLKLMAADTESVHILSSLLQDAITAPEWMVFSKGKIKIFFNRFCWETKVNQEKEKKESFCRINSIVTIHNVDNGIKRNLKINKELKLISLLAISCVDSRIILTFSEGEMILNITDINVSLTDVSSHWFTQHKPKHNIIPYLQKNKSPQL